jgi:hypothetical protein
MSGIYAADGSYNVTVVDGLGAPTAAGTSDTEATAVQGVLDGVPLPAVGSGDVLDVTLSLDTSAYADGDVLADTQTITNAARVSGGKLLLQSVHVLDEDDQGQPFDLIFLDTSNSLGTENLAPNISDANARKILGRVPISSGDYYDIGGSRIATLTGINLYMKTSGTRDLYIGAISRGTGTYTASGIKLKLGVAWD